MPKDGETTDCPMRRAVAFSNRIKDSQKITNLFAEIIKDYTGDTTGDTKSESAAAEASEFLKCEAKHVDGKMNALLRNEALQWLKEDTTREGTVCRILSNARCLSEGVDVPALDAVMFLNPRKSVVDVVQSVGSVMRKSEGKQCGYLLEQVLSSFLSNLDEDNLRKRCEESARRYAVHFPNSAPFASPVHWVAFTSSGLAYTLAR